MDLAQILRELSRQRYWLILGAVIAIFAGVLTGYKLTLSPVGLEKRSIELGAAQTQLLVDSSSSRIIDARGDLLPLVTRSAVYAQLMSSTPVTNQIARTAKIPPQLIEAQSATAGPGGSEQRSNQILKEKQGYRLLFASQQDQPLISVSSQAPSAEEAVTLANAAAKAISTYITRQQAAQRVPQGRRIQLRQLGPATGGLLNPGVNKAAAVLVSIAAFIGFCLLVLLISNVASNIRASRLLGDLSVADEAAPFATWAQRRRASGASTEALPENEAEDADETSGAPGRGISRL